MNDFGKRRRVRFAAAWLATAMALPVLGGAPAQAAITTPADGQTVRGEVLIHENRGGVEDSVCAFAGARANSTITVTRLSDNATVLNISKGSAGPWSTTWDSRPELANGLYRIQSVARDRGPWYLLCPTTVRVLSTITVRLENFMAFTDDLGGGTVSVNPYLKVFRFVSDSYDSGNRHAPDMQIVPLPVAPQPPCDPSGDPAACAPAAPALPSLHPACADPTSPTFVPFLLQFGPQGCLSPNPVPPVTVPPALPEPPDPNNPPSPPENAQCRVGGCGDVAIVIAFAGDDFALAGVFHAETRAFVAGAATLGEAPTATVLHHQPLPGA
ncbi:MAG TPA: hypothetical protein VM841_00675 [Actinomycetota bacterium]|nr:hypothetical protein [Actinomycetota bacterium]